MVYEISWFYISTPGLLFMARVPALFKENSKIFSRTKDNCFSSLLLWCVVALNIETFYIGFLGFEL